jgi:hypothetical protein
MITTDYLASPPFCLQAVIGIRVDFPSMVQSTKKPIFPPL